MKTKTVIIAAIASACVLMVGVWRLPAAPAIGTTRAKPSTIAATTATDVLLTAQISDTSVLPGGVNLLRVDSSGRTVSNLGVMSDDGTNGDAISGDRVFSRLISLNEPKAGSVYFQVSAAFRGVLKRSLSPPISVTVHDSAVLSLVEVAASSSAIVRAFVGQSQAVDTGHLLMTRISVTPDQLVKGPTHSGTITVRLLGGRNGTVTDVALGTPILQSGSRYLLFLSGPNSEGDYSLSAEALSAFRIVPDPVRGDLAIVDPAYKSLDFAEPLDPVLVDLLARSEARTLTVNELLSTIGY